MFVGLSISILEIVLFRTLRIVNFQTQYSDVKNNILYLTNTLFLGIK